MKRSSNKNFKGIIDTTFRDGQQSPYLFDTYKYRFTLDDKKLLVEGLVKLGVTHFEFFSPVVSNVEKQDFSQIRQFIKTITKKSIHLLAHCRCHPDDISQAIEAGFDGLHLYMGASKHAQQYSYQKSIKEIRTLVRTTIETIRKNIRVYIFGLVVKMRFGLILPTSIVSTTKSRLLFKHLGCPTLQESRLPTTLPHGCGH